MTQEDENGDAVQVVAVKRLRDEFAMAALTGMLADRTGRPNMANDAYFYADLMLKERLK